METKEIAFVRLPELLAMLKMARSTVYGRMNPRSRSFDARFPKKIKDGGRVLWVRQEVEAWMLTLSNNRP
ncbi:AlpA family phage regulatory protein [Chitinibacter sp. SCUT-21]|uniref:helix-turn-helix transcriptional regulator n=1 Tax=Chitinibacter sp. SCUT-21 TaxID=2970891 RepID=UPI0035A6BB17